MPYPFDESAINSQLTESLNFINTYTRNTFPLFASNLKLPTEQFHKSFGNQDKIYDHQISYAKTIVNLGVALFKAFEATGNIAYRTRALEVTEAYVNYLFIDNIFTQSNQGIDTPWLRNHWAILAYDFIQTEGSKNGEDPFNFGTSNTLYFTNGVRILNTNLIRFFKAFTGNTQYKNPFAALRDDGVEYPIQYFVDKFGYKVFPSGVRSLTNEERGTVRLVSDFTGNLTCIYATSNDSFMFSNTTAFSGSSLIEKNPIVFRTVEFGRVYTSAHTDVAWTAYWLFDYAFKHSALTKYSNAREITKWNALKFAIYSDFTNSSFYLKKELATNPLRHPGSAIIQTFRDESGNLRIPSGYSATRETFSPVLHYLKIVVNADNYSAAYSVSYAQLDVTNELLITAYNSAVDFSVEVASNIDQLLQVNLDVGQDLETPNIFTFYWQILGNPIAQSRNKNLSAKSFIRYSTTSIWNITLAKVPVIVGASAATQIKNVSVLDYDTAIASTEFYASNIFITLSNSRPAQKLPDVVYRLSGIIEMHLIDSANNTRIVNLGDTSDTWITYSGIWQELEDNYRTINQIKFKSVSSYAKLDLFYVGEAPELLPIPGRIRKASITTVSELAHTLWVGDFRVNNNLLNTQKYAVGMVPYAIDSLTSSTSVTVSPKEQYYCSHQSALSIYSWKSDMTPSGVIPPELNAVINFLNDSQNNFNTQAIDGIKGFLIPTYHPYSLENYPNFETWQFQGLDSDTSHIKHNNQALEDLARYFLLNQKDSTARKIITEYIEFIANFYTLYPNKVINALQANDALDTNGFNPGMAAIEGIIALYANLAGIEIIKTYKLIKNRFDYIDSQYQATGNMAGSWTKDQPTFTTGGQLYSENFSSWQAKITEFYSELLLNKDKIRGVIVTSDNIFPYFLNFNTGNIEGNNFAHFITSIKEAEYPTSEQIYATGNKQTILLSSNITGKVITLKFNNLDKIKSAVIIDFYYQVNADNDGKFYFDNSQINYNDFEGVWVFEEPPKITTKISSNTLAVFDIELTIKQI
jgi:hypothetical protein